MRPILLYAFLSLFFFISPASAQYTTPQNNIWAFGFSAGIDFNSGSPVAISTNISTSEGAASVCDASGALLFYTDGRRVWNRIGGVMPNGGALVTVTVSSSTQGALIVPVIGNPNQYYVFSLGEITSGVGWCLLYYSVVDMTLAGGMGDVIVSSRGTPMGSNLGEKMISIQGNACNIWVLVHRKDSAKFLAYEVTAAGINMTPVVSNVGSFTTANSYAVGVIKASPDRTKVMSACYNFGSQMGTELYDFDPSTGIVSNCQVLNNTTTQYGAEFSPDSRKLYVAENVGTARVYQYDISLGSTAAIIASKFLVATGAGGTGWPQMRLGPNNKLYMIGITSTTFLDCINNPNVLGAGCGFATNAVSLSPGSAIFGITAYYMAVYPDTTFARHDTLVCIPPGGTATIYAHDTGTSYVWNDGTLGRSKNITALGTYWVSVLNGCDIIIDTIVVSQLDLDPPPVISGVDTYCHGAPFVPFTVVGVGIKWYADSSSTVGTSVAPVINTAVPGTYTVWATQSILCVSPKARFTVTVLPEILPDFAISYRRGCIEDTVDLVNIPTNAEHYLWELGNGKGSDTSHLYVSSTYSVHDTFYVKLTAYNSLCSRNITKPIYASHPIKADFDATPDTLCAVTENTILTSTSVVYIPTINSIVDYKWKFGDGAEENAATGTSSNHTYTVGGVYPATLVITDNIGCKDSITKNIYALQLSIDMFNDTTICVSQPFELVNKVYLKPKIQIADYTYSWTPGINLDNAAVQHPKFYGLGVFTYTFTSSLTRFGCAVSDTVRINSVMGKKLANVTQNVSITYGSSAFLNADSLVYYRWVPNDGSLDNPNINNPVAQPTITTQYTVYGYDGNGCLDSAYVTVRVDSTMKECMPSAFTPNGDGRNDVFRPICMEYQKSVEFRVFNRWGEQVFYSNNARTGWDGTYKGAAQDLGVYYYVLVVARPGGDGQNVVYKGEVTLIR